MKRLRSRELCPLHKSYFCCGRKSPLERKNTAPKFRARSEAVEIIQDEFHPRGYREKCSPSELRRRKHELIRDRASCLYCPEPFTSYSEIDLAHKEPKGMGGARHDDHRSNLGLAHRACNHANGSKRPAA